MNVPEAYIIRQARYANCTRMLQGVWRHTKRKKAASGRHEICSAADGHSLSDKQHLHMTINPTPLRLNSRIISLALLGICCCSRPNSEEVLVKRNSNRQVQCPVALIGGSPKVAAIWQWSVLAAIAHTRLQESGKIHIAILTSRDDPSDTTGVSGSDRERKTDDMDKDAMFIEEIKSYVLSIKAENISKISIIAEFIYIDEQKKSNSLSSILNRADIIYIEGGDQTKYRSFFADTPVEENINEACFKRQAVLMGSSAGAHILSSSTSYPPVGAMDLDEVLYNPFPAFDTSNPYLGGTSQRVEFHSGFLKDIVPDTLVETHTTERCRILRAIPYLGRLHVDDVKRNPLGIALDERTALVIEPLKNKDGRKNGADLALDLLKLPRPSYELKEQDQLATVIGHGTVTFLSASKTAQYKIRAAIPPLVTPVNAHSLPEGYVVNLSEDVGKKTASNTFPFIVSSPRENIVKFDSEIAQKTRSDYRIHIGKELLQSAGFDKGKPEFETTKPESRTRLLAEGRLNLTVNLRNKDVLENFFAATNWETNPRDACGAPFWGMYKLASDGQREPMHAVFLTSKNGVSVEKNRITPSNAEQSIGIFSGKDVVEYSLTNRKVVSTLSGQQTNVQPQSSGYVGGKWHVFSAPCYFSLTTNDVVCPAENTCTMHNQ